MSASVVIQLTLKKSVDNGTFLHLNYDTIQDVAKAHMYERENSHSRQYYFVHLWFVLRVLYDNSIFFVSRSNSGTERGERQACVYLAALRGG